MGVIKQTGKRWASTLFGTRTLGDHVGTAVGAVLVGCVLPAAWRSALSDDPQIAQHAAIVAAVAVAVVVVWSTIFAAFKDEYLGVGDPHWHTPKKQVTRTPGRGINHHLLVFVTPRRSPFGLARRSDSSSWVFKAKRRL